MHFPASIYSIELEKFQVPPQLSTVLLPPSSTPQSSSIKHTGENLCSVAAFPHFRQFQFLVQLPSSIKETVWLAEVLGRVCWFLFVLLFGVSGLCALFFFLKHLPERILYDI